VLLIDGEPVPYALGTHSGRARQPRQSRRRRYRRRPALNERISGLCQQIGPALRQAGVLSPAWNVIGGYVTRSTSPVPPACVSSSAQSTRHRRAVDECHRAPACRPGRTDSGCPAVILIGVSAAKPQFSQPRGLLRCVRASAGHRAADPSCCSWRTLHAIVNPRTDFRGRQATRALIRRTRCAVVTNGGAGSAIQRPGGLSCAAHPVGQR